MKKILLIFTILLSLNVFSKEPKLILLQPTGDRTDGISEMKIIPDSSQLYISFSEIVKTTVIKEFLEIHDLLQIYLLNTRGKPIEPAYLALTDNQGGYAVDGFILVDGDQKIRKDDSFYVDINKNVLDRDYRSLMSITQLYPHELGHILYRLLSSSKEIDESSMNVNVHFFSLNTDYQIAFNEGFAEHLENIARLFEANQEVIDGIQRDTVRITKIAGRTVPGFIRDFKNPLRFGFYKMTMLAWYQPFEDYKRYAYPLDGRSKFVNASIHTSNQQNNLIFRNSGVSYDTTTIRNKVQVMANEGMISTFFTLLSQSDAKHLYKSTEFYRSFLKDSTKQGSVQTKLSPLQNLFVKYFYVLDNYVSVEASKSAQLIDFIEGYIQSFPEEDDIIKTTYRKATGHSYSPYLPNDLWLMIKDQPHGILALDAYAGLTVPVYTFSLNAAEMEDLMMIDGLTEEDARAILDHRGKHFINDIKALERVNGLSPEGLELITSHQFDATYFENLPFPEELNIQSVITAPLKKLGWYSLIYFIILMGIHFYMVRKQKTTIKKILVQILRFIPIWMLFVLTGLFSAAFGWHWAISLLLTVSVFFISGLFMKKIDRRQTDIITILMTLIIIFSLV